jgi:enoyl-CoA hydratase
MKNLLVELQGATQLITINRPNQLNALNKETIQELHDALQAAATNKNVEVLVITGSGDKSFVAGADIKEFAHFGVADGARLAAKGQRLLFDYIQNFRKPVIAAVNGFALGGGLELAMACHIRYASDTARMGLPETSLGVIPGYGGTQRLAQLIGKGMAMELIFTAKMIKAAEALHLGLVNKVLPHGELLAACFDLAETIQKNSLVAIGFAIDAINAGFTDGVNGFDAEIKAFGDCFGTADFREGTTAFIEKRKADFPGE